MVLKFDNLIVVVYRHDIDYSIYNIDKLPFILYLTFIMIYTI